MTLAFARKRNKPSKNQGPVDRYKAMGAIVAKRILVTPTGFEPVLPA